MSRVPIRNLYAMLAYASRDIDLFSDQEIGACDFERPLDLVARLLDASMRRLRQRGLDRCYVTLEEQGTHPRGTLAIDRTLARLLHVQGQLAWSVDELLADTGSNRLLKCALRGLLRSSRVTPAVRQRLRRHLASLAAVQDIDPGPALALRPPIPRALPEYRHALRLARLALEGLLPDEGAMGRSWRALWNDPERMGDLFERFVRGFAKHHLAGQAWVGVRQHSWNAVAQSGSDASLLPAMITDVQIEWHDAPPTIVECKFYREAFVSGAYGDTRKLHSAHLYQLTAYLRAAPAGADGLLLYAQGGQAFRGGWTIDGAHVSVATLRLDVEWTELAEGLMEVLARRVATGAG